MSDRIVITKCFRQAPGTHKGDREIFVGRNSLEPMFQLVFPICSLLSPFTSAASPSSSLPLGFTLQIRTETDITSHELTFAQPSWPLFYPVSRQTIPFPSSPSPKFASSPHSSNCCFTWNITSLTITTKSLLPELLSECIHMPMMPKNYMGCNTANYPPPSPIPPSLQPPRQSDRKSVSL